MNTSYLTTEFLGDLRDLYFFYNFSSLGLKEQRLQLENAQRITRNALEKEYGTSQTYINTKKASLTIAEEVYKFSSPAKENLLLSFDVLIDSSGEEGSYSFRVREYVVILLAELWENKYRPHYEEAGVVTASDFWGSVVRIRNSLLHAHRILDRELYDQETFHYLKRGCEIKFTELQINMIFDKAFIEVKNFENDENI